VGCGDSNNGPTPQGNFSNASLNGNYTYQFSGFDLNTGNPYVRSGVMVFDGSGGITSGIDDFSELDVPVTNNITGAYAVSNDGTGQVQMNLQSGNVLTFAITLVSTDKFNMIEADNFASGAGAVEKQTTSAFNTTPSGTFVFRMHRVDSTLTTTGSVGSMTINGGVITTGSEDIVTAGGSGLVSPAITSGLFNTPDPTTGRGTGSFTDSRPATIPFNYYIVDSSHIRIFTIDNVSGLGSATLQTGGPFTNASLSGSYAYQLSGDTIANFEGVQTVGRFSASNGTISDGRSDAQVDGNAQANQTFTGTYTVAANGRAVVDLSYAGGGSPEHIYWLISPTRAYFLKNDADQAAEASVVAQTATSFSTSTLNGQFGFFEDGQNLNGFVTVDRVGTLQWDGKGNLTLNEFVNLGGATNTPGFLDGNYTINSNEGGRATGAITGGSNPVNWTFYIISNTDAYLIGTNSGGQTSGAISLQSD
jgi:hypothetical protein